MQDLEIFNQMEVTPFSTSSTRLKYLVCFNERYFEVGVSIAKLIQALKSSTSLSEVALNYQDISGKKYSKEEIEALIKRYIEPIISVQKKSKNSPLFFNIELISAKTISLFSNILKVFFYPPIIIVLILSVIFLEGFFLSGTLSVINIYDLDLYTLGGIFILFVCSSFFHELGHASACKYFNTNHGGVGFGLYLNFPVFYTDVSGIWKLSRKKRIIINVAGVYFQLIFLIPLFAIYFYTYDNILKYFILAANINLLFTLNPFFKFDGYWIISDLLGVPNLRRRTTEFFKYLFQRLRKQPITQTPFLLGMRKREKIFMLVYSIVVNCFFIAYFCYLLPAFLIQFFQTYPSLLKSCINQLASGQALDYKSLQTLISQFIFFALTLVILIKILNPLIRKILKKKNNNQHTDYKM